MSRDVSPVKDGFTEVFTENSQVNLNHSMQELTQNSDSDQCKVDVPTLHIPLAAGIAPHETYNDHLRRMFWEEK